jgi:hypothetical protein
MHQSFWSLIVASFALSVFGQEEEVEIEIIRSVIVTFQSESGKSYQLLSSPAAAGGQFQAVGETVTGNGGKITVFYESERIIRRCFSKWSKRTATHPLRRTWKRRFGLIISPLNLG